jgi:arginyl-tRNA synthetase
MEAGDVIKNCLEGVIKELQLSFPEVIHLEHPGEEEHGDYATNVALKIKSQKSKVKTKSKISNLKNPREIAEVIAEKLRQDQELMKVMNKVEVAGAGFINFWLKKEVLVGELSEIVKKRDKYGLGAWGKGKTWLLEHTSPNPNKAMHLGHLRNNVTGMAIGNLWEYSGVKVIRDCIDNDRGIAIAKLMWGYLKFARKKEGVPVELNYWDKHRDEWLTPKDENIRPDRFVDELYVKASQELKENKDVEKQVRRLVVDWEAGDKLTWELWKKVLKYSHEGQNLTLERLGSRWDWVWHEHEHYRQGKKLVEEGLKKGIFKQLEDGAVITDLKNYGITDTVVRKSDGTALYITQDLALTKLKQEKFKPDRMFWVIGPEQSLALKQMFAVCDQLGIVRYEDCTHLAYGYISVKGQGKMSSRKGNVVYIDELIDAAKEEIKKKIGDRGFSQEEIDLVAEKVAVGAVKYSILRAGRLTDTAFDFATSLAIEGNSGPYLQYTYARTQSVLRKSQKSNKFQISNFKLNQEELAILRWIYRFPEVVEEAARMYAPNLVCNFLYELAGRFNTFYNQHSILGLNEGRLQESEFRSQNRNDEIPNYKDQTNANKTKNFRLLLTATTGQVLKNGLGLLGIEAVERM